MMLVLSAVEWIASDFVIRISYFSMLDNSLPNMKIRPTTIYLLPITSYHLAFGISTLVESALQINPFLTNKANFQKSQMNVNKALTKDYGKMDTWSNGKNKAKTKPIQTQYKPKTNPIQTQYLPATPFGRACPPPVWRDGGKKMLSRLTIKGRRLLWIPAPKQAGVSFAGTIANPRGKDEGWILIDCRHGIVDN